jgi:hypothetical protein
MAQRKKTAGSVSQQKAEMARMRNEFTSQLKTFLEKTVGPEVFRLIPQQEIEGQIYKFRLHAMRVQAAPGQHISAAMLKSAKNWATLLFRLNSIDFGIGELAQLPFRDYFSIGITVIEYAKRLKEDDYPHAAAIKKALAPFRAFEKSQGYIKAWEDCLRVMHMISMFHSDLGDCLYALKNELRAFEEGEKGLGWCLEIYAQQVPKIQVNIQEHPRPAYRLAWYVSRPELHFDPVSVASEDVYLPPGQLLEVYIQSHALERLYERMDGAMTGILHIHVYDSLKKPRVCKNRKGDLLFEYKIHGEKAGYFTAEIVDGKIILTTFLFLTNNSTPEGDALYHNKRITKDDKAYLAIDKLSSFVNSDIASNERVKQMFIEAGCESLFKLDKTLCTSPDSKEEKKMADFVAQYLQLPPLNE